ncbi:MAG TPA: PBP1A family penicillin-binding protein [Myxococcota bacterium]|nr:PBP1A family penicillin-binding protein [Myxococcota bacterium]
MRRLLKIAVALAVLGAVTTIVGVTLFYAVVLRDLPEINKLEDYRPNLITRVLDVDGNEVASFAKERRVVVPIEQIPKPVVEAFIAAEDGSFYEHTGLDYGGILRAAFTNFIEGRKAQGASTITQQVAKTFLLSPERSYTRKLKDMVLARRIEKALSKNDILYLYLNQIYFGAGAYGVEAASQTYFGKSARELQVNEAALLAGLVPRPAEWNPHVDPEMARRKQLLVLHRMVEQRFLAPEQHDMWAAQPMIFAKPHWQERDSATAFFVEEVRRYLMQHFGGDEVLTGGLTVHTTLDVTQQIDAWRAVRRGLREHDRRMGYRGPLRNVPEKDWAGARAEIAAANAAVLEPAEEELRQGLVIALDDKAQKVTLALGPEPDDRATLGLADVNWAAAPDPARDGMYPHVTRVSQALHKGDVVLLERGADGKTWSLYQKPLAEGALLAVDLEKSELKAVVGGYSFAASEFDRALQSRRQPGSAFKPIVYAAALARGFTGATIVHDTAVVYDDDANGFAWKPENYSEDFFGPITLRTALAKSRNAATIRVLSDIGLAPVQGMAKALGIESPMEMNLGLALGNSEVTLGELVRAYTAFATGGKVIDPVFVLEVRDRNGRVLAQNVHLLEASKEPLTPPVGEGADESAGPGPDLDRVMEKLRAEVEGKTTPGLPEGYHLDPIDAYLMTDMLRAVVDEGTGTKVKALGRPVAGKTGTTNDLRDAWFIGYTPELAAGVWIGYDAARNLGKNETGGRTAAPVFLEYMKKALEQRPVQEFSVPEGVVFARVDRATGLLAPSGDENAIFMPFREGAAPTEVSPTQNGDAAARPLRVD